MAISIKSNADGVSGAIQINGVDVAAFNGSGFTSGAPAAEVTAANSVTLTNKTISYANNTLTGVQPTVPVATTQEMSAGTETAVRLMSPAQVKQTISSVALPAIGQPYGGGYFAGVTYVGSTPYALIVAPKASGEAQKQWKTTNDATTGTTSLEDGWTNSNNMNNVNHPAAQFCRSLSIGGYTDWYLPAKEELCLLFANFTVTGAQASTVSYRVSIPEADKFTADTYWSSSEYSSTGSWLQRFNNGYQSNLTKYDTTYVRAVRRLAL